MRSTQDQLLFELKTRGPATTRDLAARAGITRQAARAHLTNLAAAELVEHARASMARPLGPDINVETEPPSQAWGQAPDDVNREPPRFGGAGRPGHSWSLTEKGHGRFPDTHAQMTVELIAAIRDEFGEGGIARMLTRREQAMATKYEEALRGAVTLEERVARLARLRTAEGYMADATCRDDENFIIVENHCPICAAATACQGFCRSELALFERLLAPARVERSEHLLAGCRRCCYLIAPASH